MSWKHLGETFDIHGGGIDLVFPHHENEIAQSRCAFHTPMLAHVWMHNGFLQVEGEKMAKSAGNFVTIRQLRENWGGHPWPGEALRFNMLRTHYRQPIDWTLSALDETHKVLWDWYADLKEIPPHRDLPTEVLNALCDDLNTPQAISVLHKLHSEGDLTRLSAALNFLGFSGDRTKLIRHYVVKAETGHYQIGGGDAQLRTEIVGGGVSAGQGISSDRVNKMIAARNAARKAKNWAESDRIRDELAGMGVVLKDNKDGTTTWEVAR
jgi:cysteinyl-tRNA synthetase